MTQSHPCRVRDYDIFPRVTICNLTHGLNIASLQDFETAFLIPLPFERRHNHQDWNCAIHSIRIAPCNFVHPDPIYLDRERIFTDYLHISIVSQ